PTQHAPPPHLSPTPPPSPYTTPFRSLGFRPARPARGVRAAASARASLQEYSGTRSEDRVSPARRAILECHVPRTLGSRRSQRGGDRKGTRLNSSDLGISYAGFCLTKN